MRCSNSNHHCFNFLRVFATIHNLLETINFPNKLISNVDSTQKIMRRKRPVTKSSNSSAVINILMAFLRIKEPAIKLTDNKREHYLMM